MAISPASSASSPGLGRAPFRVGEHRQRSGINVRTASGAGAPVPDMARCVAVLEPVDRQCPSRLPLSRALPVATCAVGTRFTITRSS
jgi:hypothetical protein